MPTLLFLCTGNSCRSQIAEGYAKALAKPNITVISAGIQAHGKNPKAIATMQADGIDISQQDSTKLTDDMLQQADVLVTVCGHADEHCPVLPAGKQKFHWPLDDPAKATGDDATVAGIFAASRDDIKQRTHTLLQQLGWLK